MIWKTHESLRLVGGLNPSEKWWSESQLGWWNSQYDGKNNPNVPNHQPVLDGRLNKATSWLGQIYSIVRQIPHWQYVSPTNIHHIFYPIFLNTAESGVLSRRQTCVIYGVSLGQGFIVGLLTARQHQSHKWLANFFARQKSRWNQYIIR